MSTMASDRHHGGLAHTVARLASRVSITVPANASMRDAVLADFRRAHGLDLSDDDRAAKIRAKRS